MKKKIFIYIFILNSIFMNFLILNINNTEIKKKKKKKEIYI